MLVTETIVRATGTIGGTDDYCTVGYNLEGASSYIFASVETQNQLMEHLPERPPVGIVCIVTFTSASRLLPNRR